MHHTIHDCLQSVVTVTTLGRTGTGFVVSADGHLLTTAHCVVDDSVGGRYVQGRVITVAFRGGGTASAVLVGFDMHADVAVLRLSQYASLPRPIPVRRHTHPAPGDTCVVVGNIFGQDPRSVSVGTVRNGRWHDPLGLSLLSTVLTDVATGAGTSGGPILDTAGHVVALHTAAYGGGVPGVRLGHPLRVRSPRAGPPDRTTMLGGGVASPMLWRIYEAIRCSGGSSLPKHVLPCVTLPRPAGIQVLSVPPGGVLRVGDLVRSVDGVPVGAGHASVHDCTWLHGPGPCTLVVDDHSGGRRVVSPVLVPLPASRDVAVGRVQSYPVFSETDDYGPYCDDDGTPCENDVHPFNTPQHAQPTPQHAQPTSPPHNPIPPHLFDENFASSDLMDAI